MGLPPELIAQQFCTIEPANIYSTEWIPASENWYRGQNREYDHGSRRFSYWQFTAYPIGELFIPTTLLPVNRDRADLLCSQADNGVPASSLKVEVDYVLGQSQVRSIRMDIGSGIVVPIPPTFRVMARVLVPNPDTALEVVPAGYDPDQAIVSRVVLSAICVPDVPPTTVTETKWSTPIHVEDPFIANTTVDVAVEPGAVEADACFTTVPGGTLEFIYQRFDNTGALIDETVVGTATLASATDTCFQRTPIPSEANVIRYTEVVAPPGRTGTINQYLQFP